ncbi:MAG: type II toxin-antitoxin system RelB/DinJ family antitoxin [Succiniclasticum sp.]|jgi:addiction module RelB/DinJ family antitoxin|nr:type II toxin-antitoxin system RelB/DinJ family antitoxin [Succiniclasticum sp.]MEE3479792.1 type II toxin-antitoxin system RelB/DinJ family antitoxin [Succiniclasticum sp.]
MEKTATLNLRISPQVKSEAEKVLDQLGIPMSVAVSVYLKQIALTRGIPFPLQLPDPPASISLDAMTPAQIQYAVAEGLEEYKAGKTVPAEDAFRQFNAKKAKK